MHLYNLKKLKTSKTDTFAKNALMIFGNNGNIWQGKILSKCSKNFDVVLIKLKPGEQIKPHKHTTSEEISFILKGSGIITEGTQTKKVKSNDIIYLANNLKHSFKAGRSGLEWLDFHAPGMSDRS